MSRLRQFAAGALALCTAATAAAAPPLKGFVIARPATQHYDRSEFPGVSAGASLPLWNYSVTAGSDLGGATYTGSIVGTNPSLGTSTTVPTQIVPLVITITDASGKVVYDPTKLDSCGTVGSPLSLVKASPIFQKVSWTSNGANVGKTQYIDAFNRAEFWSVAQGGNYHVLLAPKVLKAQKISYNSSLGANLDATQYGGCGHIGLIDINTMDSLVQGIVKKLSTQINPGTFPIFITKDVVETEGGNDVNHCCVLGYHSGFYTGSNLQIYSPFAFDVSGLFGGDVTTLAHEMGEAINDPTGTNPTPVWGNIGQVQGHCQGNFEVGDPLSPGWPGSPAVYPITGTNGFTYHVQDLAFFNWFFGGANQGSGGKYSMFGNFGGDARLCSAGGGTN